MRLVIQRVNWASVTVAGECCESIGQGLLVLVGVAPGDGPEDIQWLSQKLDRMRIFRDDAGKMNLSRRDIEGELLLVSQFTLFASTKKGNRPSFTESAGPDEGKACFNAFVKSMETLCPGKVQTGVFGADMTVSLENQGPVTIVMDSRDRK